VARPERYEDLRRKIRKLCADFPGAYWRELDARREYPEAFIEALTHSGYLGAPISTNLILSYVAEHVLGLPRSF